jgi:hypothetical protein
VTGGRHRGGGDRTPEEGVSLGRDPMLELEEPEPGTSGVAGRGQHGVGWRGVWCGGRRACGRFG